jgi:hypothetical protein
MGTWFREQTRIIRMAHTLLTVCGRKPYDRFLLYHTLRAFGLFAASAMNRSKTDWAKSSDRFLQRAYAIPEETTNRAVHPPKADAAPGGTSNAQRSPASESTANGANIVSKQRNRP